MHQTKRHEIEDKCLVPSEYLDDQERAPFKKIEPDFLKPQNIDMTGAEKKPDHGKHGNRDTERNQQDVIPAQLP